MNRTDPTRQALRLSFALVITLATLFSCSNETKEAKTELAPADLLMESFPTAEHTRSSTVRTFAGQDLYELINGGAELFHRYQFVEVANAYYTTGATEMAADIFEFAGADLAYGLFSTLRPMETESAGLGVESVRSATSVLFVKGKFIVRVTGFEETEESAKAVLNLSLAIEPSIPGTNDLPELFKLFPVDHRLPGTNKIIAVDFLGRKGLPNIYTTDYLIDDEQITLFIADDLSGGKFLSLKTHVETAPAAKTSLPELPYDKDLSLILGSSYYGNIVAGLKNGKLCGMTGYQEKHKQALSDWLKTL